MGNPCEFDIYLINVVGWLESINNFVFSTFACDVGFNNNNNNTVKLRVHYRGVIEISYHQITTEGPLRAGIEGITSKMKLPPLVRTSKIHQSVLAMLIMSSNGSFLIILC